MLTRISTSDCSRTAHPLNSEDSLVCDSKSCVDHIIHQRSLVLPPSTPRWPANSPRPSLVIYADRSSYPSQREHRVLMAHTLDPRNQDGLGRIVVVSWLPNGICVPIPLCRDVCRRTLEQRQWEEVRLMCRNIAPLQWAQASPANGPQPPTPGVDAARGAYPRRLINSYKRSGAGGLSGHFPTSLSFSSRSLSFHRLEARRARFSEPVAHSFEELCSLHLVLPFLPFFQCTLPHARSLLTT
ncbi:hypothetical protein NUW54_g4860 [Trametes sanguinea]|uniref:Uncharacterized protein n=1 Tax=Trametes sanguinea TaxID=158606 RepID=A0ACC1Q073_9APHY|nr:hypothetical protein NUW54_g4860 [Trametes sanguinea]